MLEPLPKELQAKAIANALESSSPTSRPSISILGYGVTTKPIVAFLNALGKACAIYDDKPEEKGVEMKNADSSGGGDVENILLDSREFCPESSALEILSPGIPPDHRYFGGARRAISEYDFIWWLENSASGSHSSDFVDFGATADHQSSSAPKSTKSTTSNTANPRILEEKQAKSKNQTAQESSSRADEVGVAIHKSTQVDSRGDYSASTESMDCHATATAAARNDRKNAIGEKADSRENAESVKMPQAAGFCDDFLKKPAAAAPCTAAAGFVGCQAVGEGIYLSGNEQAHRADSRKSAQKPTPHTQIWVSGTNGKTTTTQMLTHILAPFGALSGGNIGTPLITLYEQNAPLWVLETSSFALHYTKAATPAIYALLPLSPDHISWHNGFENYVCDKLSPLARMGADSVAIVPSALKDHRLCKEFAGEMVLYRDSNDLRAFLHAKGLELGENDLPFFEPFLLDASIALASAVALMSLSPSVPAQAVASFVPALARFTIGAHRMEEFYVCAFGAEWLFVDDSKGTNTDATLQAIMRYKDRALFLILGGDDKGADCTEIFTLLQHIHKVQIFTIGSNEPKLLALAREYGIKASACGSLHKAMEAIYKARDRALLALESKGSTRAESSARLAKDFACLLSPAAASLDQFSSYKERGERFKSLARSLAPSTTS